MKVHAHMYECQFDLGTLRFGYDESSRSETLISVLRDTQLMENPNYTLEITYSMRPYSAQGIKVSSRGATLTRLLRGIGKEGLYTIIIVGSVGQRISEDQIVLF